MERIVFKTREAAANHGGAMEPETISKNGASLKSHTSRGNFFRMICFALLAASIIFNSCKKNNGDDNGTSFSSFSVSSLDVKVENGAAYNDLIDEVRLEAWDCSAGKRVALETAKYSNGGFKMDLPQSVPESVVCTESHVSEDVIIIADAGDGLKAYDKDGKRIGTIIGRFENMDGMTSILYFESDVTITGNWGTRIYKKGWNLSGKIDKWVFTENYY